MACVSTLLLSTDGVRLLTHSSHKYIQKNTHSLTLFLFLVGYSTSLSFQIDTLQFMSTTPIITGLLNNPSLAFILAYSLVGTCEVLSDQLNCVCLVALTIEEIKMLC